MGTRDPRVDAYIARSADFAKPILTHLREVVHASCPDVEETLKWSSPSFTYKGILCGMAAFKQHCIFGFWKGALVVERAGGSAEDPRVQFGRLTTLADLPPKRLLARYIKEAMRLNDDGVKSPRRRKPPKKALAMPDDLAAALRRSAKARTTFEGLSPSNKRDYLEWIADAKGEDTRKRRLATTIEWLSEGKPRNWKYMRPSKAALGSRQG